MEIIKENIIPSHNQNDEILNMKYEILNIILQWIMIPEL